MLCSLLKPLRVVDSQSLWVDGELQEQTRSIVVFPIGATVNAPAPHALPPAGAPFEVEVIHGESSARVIVTRSTLDSITTYTAEWRHYLAREEYIAKMDHQIRLVQL